ncbi:unnamed protein product, partial [Adineta steineri]
QLNATTIVGQTGILRNNSTLLDKL